jgi:hydrogenase maturation protease
MRLETSNLELQTPIVVLGLGNPLMADEGIGVYLIERLRERGSRYLGVDFIDAGTGGMSVLHWIEGRHKAVFIDCACMDLEPGAIRRFTPDEVRSAKVLAHQSLHEADLLHILALAEQLDQGPKEVVIFGIEPETVEPRQGLSDILVEKVEQYLSDIEVELIAAVDSHQ